MKQKNLLLVACVMLMGCSLPPNQSDKDQLIVSDQQYWQQTMALQAPQHSEGLTAIMALDDAFLSIASRLYLIRNAKHHIDLQYYIWNDDFIGRLMLAELLAAADRGVNVRLLIDDQNGTQLDDQLKALARHPHFQIKIYNPYQYRHFRALDYIFRLKKINRRMHNKLIIADGAIAVTGGRNISSEYFEASRHFQFTDLDALFYGASVAQANQVFLQFWNDELSYEPRQLMQIGQEDDLIQLRQNYKIQQISQEDVESKIKVAQMLLQSQFYNRQIQWAKANFIADPPHKTRAEAAPETLLYQQITDLMGQPKQQLELISAYFVPTAAGTEYLTRLAKKGVKIRVLTNSFLANDVAIVHAFYKKYRQELLKNGVELYEFKPYLQRDQKTWYETLTGNLIPAKGKNASSLHAKFFDVDDKIFIGSFNFDPRSVILNTEVGLVVESSAFQQDISKKLDQYLPKIAYKLQLDSQGNLIWIEQTTNGELIHRHEPYSKDSQRLMLNLVSATPFEGLM